MSRTLDGSYWALVGTQFLTVVNDSAFKQIVLLWSVALMAQSDAARDYQAEASFVFGVPFVLCASFFGDLADRWPKPRVVVAAKYAEIAVMALATLGLWMQDFVLTWIALGLMGTQSAMLGPAKYGLVPELVDRRSLPAGNSVLQMFVVAGILLGTGGAGSSEGVAAGSRWMYTAGFAVAALAGALLAGRIRPLPAADPGRRLRFRPLRRIREGWALARSRPGLGTAVFGHAVYWFCGALVVLSWNELGQSFQDRGWVGKDIWTYGLASLSLSGAIGFLASIRVAAGGRERRLVPVAAGLVAALFLTTALVPARPAPIFGVMLAANFFAGLYLIPLKTLIQRLPDAADLGRTLGTSQLFDWLLILLASVVKWLLTLLGVTAAQSFFLLAAVMAVAAWQIARGLRAVPPGLAGPGEAARP